jgi:hypothetical protein
MSLLGIVASSKYIVSGPPVAGYKLWLDASDATSITASGGAVSQWNDKSGNASNFTQGTGADQPTTGSRTINGLNVIDFDGTNDYLLCPSSSGLFNYLHNSTGGTTFIVGIRETTGGVMHGNGGGSSAQIGHYHAINASADTDLLITNGNAGLTSALQFGLTAMGTTAFYLTNKWDANNATAANRLKESRNGAAFTGANIQTQAASNSNASHSLAIGADYTNGSANAFWNGAFGEIIFYEGILSSGDITDVQDYLATKWGI